MKIDQRDLEYVMDYLKSNDNIKLINLGDPNSIHKVIENAYL